MAHEIEEVDGVARFAFIGDRSAIWHSLGQEMPDGATPIEMMQAAKLDWQVYKAPCYAELNGTRVRTKMDALVRDSDNKILDMVSREWEPHQNIEAFEFFADVVKNGNMKMSTAGALRGGRIIFGVAEVGKDFTVFGGDRVKAHLLLSAHHQYGFATDVRFVDERVVCANTLAVAMGEDVKHQARQTHRKKFDAEEVKTMLGMATKQLETFQEAAELLGKCRYTEDSLKDYFRQVFPMTSTNDNTNVVELSRNAKKALDIVETQAGAHFAPGTMWNAFNAVTNLISHELGRDNDMKMYNALYGNNRVVAINALHTALKMAA